MIDFILVYYKSYEWQCSHSGHGYTIGASLMAIELFLRLDSNGKPRTFRSTLQPWMELRSRQFSRAFRIPGLGIPIATYGVLLALSFIAALWLTARLAERDGLPKNRIYDLGLYILASSLIGSKALMVIVEWSEFGGDWRRIFSFDLWRSAGVYYGGFLIALLVSVILMRRWKLPWRKTSDAFAPVCCVGARDWSGWLLSAGVWGKVRLVDGSQVPGGGE